MFMTAITFFSLSFYILGAAPFFSLASSICLCHALFISNLHNKNNKKKMKMIRSFDICLLFFLGCRRRRNVQIYKTHFFQHVHQHTAGYCTFRLGASGNG